MPIISGLSLNALKCPSSLLPEKYPGNWNPNQTAAMTYTSYTGTAGAATNTGTLNIVPFNQFTSGSYGWVSGNGTLFPNSKTNMKDMSDGTTNAFMVHEESNNQFDANGVKVVGPYGPITSQGPHGWAMGTRSDTQQPPSWNPQGDNRSFNCSTVRYSINQRGLADNASNGVWNNTGSNTPINSPHVGGAHVLMGDGSVRFLSQNIDLNTLLKLASIGDSQTVNDF